jgi:RHS repeat-associated protein
METDLAGNLLDEYVFFNGQRTARRRQSDGAVFYFFSDHLGTNRIVTNATGGVVEDSDFYPFGGERVVLDGLNNNYKFTGHERDGESGLDYMVARHYAFTLGRFLQPDLPFADQRPANPQTWNLFPYARNNPLYFVDPTGRGTNPWSGPSRDTPAWRSGSLGIFGVGSEYDGTPGFLSGWSEDNYYGWAFGGINTESEQNTTTSEQVEQEPSGATAPLGDAGQRAEQSINVAAGAMRRAAAGFAADILVNQTTANYFQGAGDVFILPTLVNWWTGASGSVNRRSWSYAGGFLTGFAVAAPLGAYVAATRGPQAARAAFGSGGRLNTGFFRVGWSNLPRGGGRAFSARIGNAHLDLTVVGVGTAIANFGRQMVPVIRPMIQRLWEKLQ